MIPPNYQVIYSQIGRLLQSPPLMFTEAERSSGDVLRWAAQAHAQVGLLGLEMDIAAREFETAMDRLNIGTGEAAMRKMFAILHRALAHAEVRCPGSVAGAFIPVGNHFDAFAALSKILQEAKSDVFVVDPYLDEIALTEFGLTVPGGVVYRLLGDEAMHKSSLAPAAIRWVAQHGPARPLSARLAAPKTLHDRAIFIDGAMAWTLTQSLKDFAKRSPAEIVRADDTAALKIAAYEAIWSNAKTIV